MKVKIKKLSEHAILPSYSKSGDAGLDLTATSVRHDTNGNVVYGTGLSLEIPIGFVGLLFPRSSNADKDLLLSNSVGVIDSGFRGEVKVKYKIVMRLGVEEDYVFNNYSIGDRIGQLIILPYPTIEFEETEELSDSERGTGGYGSTGN